MKIYYFALVVVALFSSLSAVTLSDDLGPDAINDDAVWDSLQGETPTFTNIVSTVYYTVSLDDFDGSWYSGEASYAGIDVTTPLGWCVIPESRRGFYEDVKCQGSGVANDKLYYFNSIATTQRDSVVAGEGISGITSTGTEPIGKWTVAVNPVEGTQCHIPYGTLMYIRFSDNNPWNGVYRAEDTGAAFRGECKIDIYAGIGKGAVDAAVADGVSNSRPQIYLLDDDLNLLPPDVRNIMGSHGSASFRYDSGFRQSKLSELIGVAQNFSEEYKNVGVDEKDELVSNFLDEGYVISSFCPMRAYNFSTASPAIFEDETEQEREGSVVLGGVVTSIVEYSEGDKAAIVSDLFNNTFALLNTPESVRRGHSIELFYDSGAEGSSLMGYSLVDNSLSVFEVGAFREGLTLSDDQILIRAFDLVAERVMVKESEVPWQHFLGEYARELAECASDSVGRCNCDIDSSLPWDSLFFDGGLLSVQNFDYFVDSGLSIKSSALTERFVAGDSYDMSKVYFDGSSLLVGKYEEDRAFCEPEKRYDLHCVAERFDVNRKTSEGILGAFRAEADIFSYSFATVSNS